MTNLWSASSCVIVVALGAGACFSDKGATTLDATVSATGDDKTTTDVMPTTGSGSGTTGSSGSGTTGDIGPGTSGGGTTSGTTGDPSAGTTGEPGSGSTSTGEPAGDPEIEMQCHDYIDLSRKVNEEFCGCLVAEGEYPDQAACIAAVFPSATYWDCWCAVYAQYPESKTLFDCAIPVVEQYGPCVAAAGCDQDSQDACATGISCMEPQAALEEVAVKCVP